jgi:hypothetical protein
MSLIHSLCSPEIVALYTKYLTIFPSSAQDAATAGAVWSVLRTNAASCDLPAHAYYVSVPRVKCVRHCLKLPGCTTYKFLGTMGHVGHCQVLVPTTPAASVTVPDAGDAGWKCYTALPGDTQKMLGLGPSQDQSGP